MGELCDSHLHLEEDKVRVDVNEDRSRMRSTTRAPEVAVDTSAEEGCGAEYSPYRGSKEEVGNESASGARSSLKRGASSAFGGLKDFVFVDGVAISEDEYIRLYGKPCCKAKKILHECDGDHQCNGVTQHGPSVDKYIFDGQDVAEDIKVPTHDENEFIPLSPGSIYRGPGDQRPLSTKAFEFVKKGAEGIASVSRTAAVEIAKVSRTTSKQVIELQNLAAPVLAPIFQAVSDEGKDQVVGPPDKGSEHEHIQRDAPKPAELERMATPYVQPVGRGVERGRKRGRVKGQVPMSQIMQQPAVEGGYTPVMLPMAGMPPQAGVPPMGVSAPRVTESQ
ncbi:hypothetical protein M758_4G071700 [Ceratodon purpureus]|nr:hypothetical protein M758_4G071700 [Ceratodon purpureus]